MSQIGFDYFWNCRSVIISRRGKLVFQNKAKIISWVRWELKRQNFKSLINCFHLNNEPKFTFFLGEIHRLSVDGFLALCLKGAQLAENGV